MPPFFSDLLARFGGRHEMSEDARPRAVVVTVGDELLLGLTVDSNAAWLGRELAGMGIDVVRRFTVGDEKAHIQDAVRRGLEEARLVLVTGGLGPTADDRTREAVAELLGSPLHVDEDLLEALRARFRRRGWDPMPEANVSQAQVPEGARVLRNDLGTAPGLALPLDDRLVVLLPGVPREMKAIVRGDLVDAVRELLGADLPPVHHLVIHTSGLPESELGRRVEDALPTDMGGVTVAFLPDERGVDLRLTVRGVGPDEARRRLARVEQALEPAVGAHRFQAESGDLVEAVSQALEARGLVLATAESCTGGLVAKRMTDRPGSSRVFLGGVVAYANEVKTGLLAVDAETLDREGAVSEAVAREMAQGVRRALAADVGLGVTGVAGPEGGTDDKPVGLVWFAVATEQGVAVRRETFTGDRSAVRERAAQAVLLMLLRRLERGG